MRRTMRRKRKISRQKENPGGGQFDWIGGEEASGGRG